jgi:ABC-type oligopeptide transport system substrate-binding subunit
VLGDQSSQVTKYQQGGFDAVGPADTYPPLDAVRSFLSNPATKDQVLNVPGGRTTWVGFNFTTGPFAGYDDTAKAGRKAFNFAIDRNALVDVACGPGGITCKPATGGVISKGLQGYLGDGADQYSKFDAAQAKTLLQQWDPGGTKRQGITYWYNANSSNKTIAENLQSQWQQNLGVHVDLQSTDFPTFLTARQDKKYIIFRDSWGADYDNPQDWFDNLFICSQAAVGLGNNNGMCDKAADALVTKAESETGDQSIADFVAAQKQLQTNVPFINVEYGANQYFLKPYLHGAGGNALYDNSWLSISIGQH